MPKIYRPDGTKFYSYIEINRMLEQSNRQVSEMEAMLKQYRDRYGELPQ